MAAVLATLCLGWASAVLGHEPTDPPPPAPESYTAAELAALDRALHAANMDRADLSFRKDLAKGFEALPAVRDMLRDPLQIARATDALATTARRVPSTVALLEAAQSLLRRADEPEGSARESPAALAPVTTPQAALDLLADRLARLQRQFPLGPAERELDLQSLRALRQVLPGQMDWHEVYASPYAAEEAAALAAFVKANGEAWTHEQAATLDLAAMTRVVIDQVWPLVAWAQALPPEAFPSDRPRILETPHGRIALGTTADDTYEGEFAILIEPGGDDRYRGCRLGAATDPERARVGLFVDLGGRDRYECAEIQFTLGAAVLGIGVALDLGAQDDWYETGQASLGAAMGGIAVFHDDGGSDRYVSKTFTQGAAGFGIAIFEDEAVQARGVSSAAEGTPDPVDLRLLDNDTLSAWANAQGFARCRGVALCVNRRGNDIYQAGGVYLHAPLFSDRYQSFSQGFAIGERGIDYAGGIAALIDLEGNDRYLGDIYNQGVGYWYSAGLLYDGAGNDLYEMTQYGQGSGIHLAVGGLVDEAGNDTYVMHSGLGQGGSHDYGASVLHDRGGNDHYMGMTSCNGCGLTNSVGLHIDRSGDDTYAARKESLNCGRAARGFSSIGVLLDLGGEDHYLGIQRDDAIWRHTDIGVGVDVSTPAAPEVAPPTAAQEPAEAQTPIPAICTYEGELTPPVFAELWALAIRWEVGENRRIVPKARERLAAFGLLVLPSLDGVMDQGASGLELRAYESILAALRDAGGAQEVEQFLRKNLVTSGQRQRVALQLVGDLKVAALATEVAGLLGGTDAPVARRAAGVLERIESRAGDEVLAAWILAADDELRVQAALGPWLAQGLAAYPAVRPLLSHPLLSVRTRLVELLANASPPLREAWRADLGGTDLGLRARRSLLDALTREREPRGGAVLAALEALLEQPDWGVRADAVRALLHLAGASSVGEEDRARAERALARIRASQEADPYVRFLLSR